MRYLMVALFSATAFMSNAQEKVKHLQPKIGRLLTFDSTEQKLIARRDQLLALDNRSSTQERELNKLLERYPEGYSSIWLTEEEGDCSWYCGGGPYKITASSYLVSSGKVNYKPENIHDFGYKAAWAEGVKGYGIGEFADCHFHSSTPRITQVKVANGYVKSEKAWFENSRVKSLKLYVDGKLYAILQLKDTKALQLFDVPPLLGKKKDGKDWVLRFEIADVYKGDKYDDTVISEIYFDGIDVH